MFDELDALDDGRYTKEILQRLFNAGTECGCPDTEGDACQTNKGRGDLPDVEALVECLTDNSLRIFRQNLVPNKVSCARSSKKSHATNEPASGASPMLVSEPEPPCCSRPRKPSG